MSFDLCVKTGLTCGLAAMCCALIGAVTLDYPRIQKVIWWTMGFFVVGVIVGAFVMIWKT